MPRTPGRDGRDPRAEQGYIHAGPNGAGHFVKMVHNGIEYGLMQAFAEGFDILKNANSESLPEDDRFDLDLTDIAEVWRRGSVISSWLLDLTASALAADPKLDGFEGVVEDSGEGRWTIMAAIDEAVPADVLSAALYTRFRSRREHTFAEKILSAMRKGFGAHVEPKARRRRHCRRRPRHHDRRQWRHLSHLSRRRSASRRSMLPGYFRRLRRSDPPAAGAGALQSRRRRAVAEGLRPDRRRAQRVVERSVSRRPRQEPAEIRHPRRSTKASLQAGCSAASPMCRASPTINATYEKIERELARIERERDTKGNRLFYLATPPAGFAPIGCHLGESGLAREDNGAWRRVIIEKPFGTDLASAHALNQKLLGVLQEDQIFRIDHYLGKETVQNILVLRFANGLFEPIWNRDHIDHVQITVAESLTVGRRGSYYDATGALRDMVPNHLFQLLVAHRHGAAVALCRRLGAGGKGEGARRHPVADARGGAAQFGAGAIWRRLSSKTARSRPIARPRTFAPTAPPRPMSRSS